MINNKGKRLGIGILAAILTIIFLYFNPAVQAAETGATSVFNDMSPTDPDISYITYLSAKGIITGYPNGSFKPQEGLTRAQAAVVIAKAAKLSLDPTATSPFKDLSNEHWARPYIAAAVKAGYISGFPDGSFKPDQPLSRAQGISLLLRLSKQAQDASLPVLKDINSQHWAASAVATGLASGMVGLSADKQNYLPDAPFSRINMAHALSILLTEDPDLSACSLPGKLKAVQGKTTMIKAGSQTEEEIKAETTVNQGDTIITRNGASAELNYPDGSSMLIKENSRINIKEAKGRKYVQTNGQEGIAVDWLNLDMKQGTMFAALAAKHESTESSSTTQNTQNTSMKYKTIASLDGKEFIAAAAQSKSQASPWYQTSKTKKVKVKVDMPWGIAAVRGTFILITIDPNGHANVSCLTGTAEVSNAGQTVPLGQNQSTTVGAAESPPGNPAAMPAAAVQQFNQVQQWVVNTAIQMDVNQEVAPAPIVEMIVEIPDQPVPETTQVEQVKTTLDVVLNALESSGIQITEQVKQEITQQLQTLPQEQTPTVNKVLEMPATPSNNQSPRSGPGSNDTVPIVSSINALNSKVTLTFSKTISEAHIDETGCWVPVVTFNDGSSYKISILDSNGVYSMCLHSVNYTIGTNTLQIITPGAQPDVQYNMTIYKGPEYTQVETTSSFTFPADTLPPEFVNDYPKMEVVSFDTATLKVQIHEIGTVYYVALLVEEISFAPKSSIELKNWVVENIASTWNGSISNLFGDPRESTLSDLRSNSYYKMYVVAEDEFGNLMPSMTVIDFQTPPADHYFTGQVFASSGGAAIPGVKVVALNSTSGVFAGSAVTNDDGQYDILIPEGDYTIVAFPGDSELPFANTCYDSNNSEGTYRFDLASIVHSDTANINFNLAPGGSIAGIVMQDENTPLPEVSVSVRLQLETYSWVEMDTISDAPDGTFAMYGLPYGNYYVSAPSVRGGGLDDDGWRKVWYPYNSIIQPELPPITVSATPATGIILIPEPASTTTATVWTYGNPPLHEMGEILSFMVVDADGNINGNNIDTVTVQIYSDTDSTGFEQTLYENAVNSGEFTGTVKISTSTNPTSSPTSIKAGVGDDVVIEYTDALDEYGNINQIRNTHITVIAPVALDIKGLTAYDGITTVALGGTGTSVDPFVLTVDPNKSIYILQFVAGSTSNEDLGTGIGLKLISSTLTTEQTNQLVAYYGTMTDPYKTYYLGALAGTNPFAVIKSDASKALVYYDGAKLNANDIDAGLGLVIPCTYPVATYTLQGTLGSQIFTYVINVQNSWL